MEKYNGWTNYATWRINLEVFDGMSLRDIAGRSSSSPFEVVECMKSIVEEIVSQYPEGLVRDYADAFLQDVDYWNIADSKIAEYADQEESEES